MQPSARYPTHEEIEVIMARARRMRSLYVGALLSNALQRLRRFLDEEGGQRGAGARRYSARRYYPDTA
jgi:hypothetical protein